MKYKILFLTAIIFAISACDKSKHSGEAKDSELQYMSFKSSDESTAPSAEPAAPPDTRNRDEIAANGQEQSNTSDLKVVLPKLTKNATLEVEIDDGKAARIEIEKIVKEMGGYISSENQNTSSYAITNTCAIRVPADKFNQLLDKVESVAKKTLNRSVSISDVTEEYVDLESRIKTKKAVEQQYRTLLTRAVKMSDILEVEEKLRVIREETEAAEGRIRYLKNQVSLSTLDLTYRQILDYKYTPESGPGFWARSWKSVVNGWEGLGDFIVGFVSFWPILLVSGLIIFMARRNKWRIWPFRKRAV